MRRCKSFDHPPEPYRILDKKPAISREAFADLGEKNGKIACRSCGLLLFFFELCLDIRRVCQDKVELALDAREHVTLLDRDVAKLVEPAILLGIPNRRRTDIDG